MAKLPLPAALTRQYTSSSLTSLPTSLSLFTPVLLLLSSLILLAPASAQDVPIYPLCPYTKRPPSRSNLTFTRCVGATKYTCCPDCYDMKLALLAVSAKGSGILNQISAGLGGVLAGKDIQLCSIFASNSACQLHLEQVVCANGCDPESGNYLEIVNNNTKGILSVCSDYSSVVYGSCKDLPLPGFGTMADFFPTKELFMTKLFGAVIGLIGKLNYTVKVKAGTEACYNGPKALPAKTLCCDPLKVPKTCPRGTVSFKENPEFRPFVGRHVDSKSCSINPSLAMLGLPEDGVATTGKKSAGDGFGGRGLMGGWFGVVVGWLGAWVLLWGGL
ncbi:hypothetical protein CLOM_g13411 [Closterium sp. NIES-68]|nr:hypothetical protein CLOM_g13411 [Closterium sp. NIES-68]GJP72424.1 hypothetical protein CLOP_g3159 [Closterium sp. NIES-67]